MDDLSICKRIAEIEGVHLKDGTVDSNGENLVLLHYEDNVIKGVWHPLTDDALTWRLMVKYDLDLISPYRKNNDTDWEALMFIDKYSDAVCVYDENPNKAILLCIIEAHKEDNND